MARPKKEQTNISDVSGKEEKFKLLFEQLNKDFGKGTIIGGNSGIEPYGDVIPVSSIALASAIGIGGFPKNKIIEIIGWESSGKSTLCNDIIANAQKTYGDDCLLIDRENSYDPFYGSNMGISLDKLSLAYPNTLEDCYSVIEKALDSKLFGVIIIDSLTSFQPKARMEGSAVMGQESRINSDKMRMVNNKIRNSNCCIVFINQIREKLGVMFGSPETTSGGNSLKFYAHLRIMIRKKEIDANSETNVMTFKIIKNKMNPPMKEAEMTIIWGKGFDMDKEAIDLAMEYGIIQKVGNTYSFEGNKLEVGEAKTISLIKDNPELLEEIKEKVLDYLKPKEVEEITILPEGIQPFNMEQLEKDIKEMFPIKTEEEISN